jgi:hypothetical protein
MIQLTTSIREAILAQNILSDVRLESIYDVIHIVQQSSNSWLFNFAYGSDDEILEVMEDIKATLLDSGLGEFELSIY